MGIALHSTPTNHFSVILTFVTSICLFAISAAVYSAHIDPSRARLETQTANLPEPQARGVIDSAINRNHTQAINSSTFHALFPETPSDLALTQSLTAILLVSPASLPQTQELIESFLQPLEHVREVVIVCSYAIVSDVRHLLQKTFASLGPTNHPDVSLRPWQGYLDPSVATFRAAMDCDADTVLILDDIGLLNVSPTMRSVLLHPPILALPFGPTGLVFESAGSPVAFLGGRAQPASYLLPPFVMPSSLVAAYADGALYNNAWLHLGETIAAGRADALGGILVSFDEVPKTSSPLHDERLALGANKEPSQNLETPPKIDDLKSSPSNKRLNSLRFVLVLPTRDDLRRLVPLICRIKSRNKHSHIRILIYAEVTDISSRLNWETEHFETYRCDIKYDVLTGLIPLTFGSHGSDLFSGWLGSSPVDILLTLDELDGAVAFLTSDNSVLNRDATMIRIPRSDLESTEWMSSLTLDEWRNWHRPRIDFSIITKDRPQSLARLLGSLANARYFGDHPYIRVNIEQDCDLETLKLVENMTWPHGRVLIHRRIVHGGLLPAVVESWYPPDNDSYGLLLEDDIELSPLYYAWIKLTLLRYRYGHLNNTTPHMFGISLYQQKHLELPPEGRRAFNPRSLFESEGLPNPTIPYLSQIPCSWGAVYFPEHWREFHDYLASRLAETVLPIKATVVPHVRSNNWSRSWKKFFIELVYLRGYVMLYPNYEDFVSLSTNHLEVGSHVKQSSLKKKELFELPLMQLQKPRESSKLLDMPDHVLPLLDDLPVLNLTGSLTSLVAIAEQGMERRNAVMGCNSLTELYDVRSLICLEMS